MCDPVQEINNAFDTVSGWVSSTLSGLSSTIENVLKNPLPTIATIGLTAIGVPAPIANAMVTAATGGSMEDMVISLATSYAGGQIGAAIGDLAVPELGGIAGYGGAGDLAFQPAASEAILKTVISNASAQGATALLQGKDLDQVLNTALTGAVGGLINTSLRTQFGLDPSNFGDRLISDATKAAVSSIFNGKDPGEAIGLALTNSAFGALANTAASGLKSTVKDLNDSTAEFETIKTQADGLREEIDSESTRLAGLSKELNSTSTALNSTQANIVASKDLLDIASNAYNGYFVEFNPAAQEAFAKRMGFEQLPDGEGNTFWAKNVQRAKTGGWDEYGNYSESYGVVSFEQVIIGTEAKAVAEQQAAYLNNTVPKFKEDVEKFNTQLATFNTDNANLNTKVNTYTGLVTELFGEDGEGGLNKKIENLLVARDGYIEDLNESVASLTEAAGEQISGAAEDIVDDAVDLLDQNYRTSDEVSEAFASNPVFRGYKPTAAEEALFVGEGKDADLQGLIDTYVDEHSLDTDELINLAGLEGYTLSDEDKASLVQQGDEDAISSRLRSEFDAKAVTSDEARQALTIGGYKPTDADIAAFTGNRSEATLNKDAAAYVDPRYLDYDEARDIARQEGYGELTAAETLRLAKNRQVGQIDEQQGVQALRNFYDSQAVTRQEAYDAFRSLGYEPSEAELNRFMGKGNETSRLSSLQTEFDPLVTTEDEVRQMYKDLGLPEPTADEISQYTGKQAETDIYGKLEDVKEERDAEAARAAKAAADAEAARVAQEEAARVAREQAEAARAAEAKAEADRLAEAARIAQEEADAQAAEAARLAQEEADLEAARVAQEQADAQAEEAERLAEAARVAQEEADAQAARVAEQEARLVEETRLAKEAEDARIAQETVNEELAQSNGFPDYATYLEFNGDQDAYLASLAPPSVEPEETLPVDEAPYVPVDDTEPPVEEPPYIPEDVPEPSISEPPLVVPEEDIEEIVPYTPGEDAEESLPPVTEEQPYTPYEGAEEIESPVIAEEVGELPAEKLADTLEGGELTDILAGEDTTEGVTGLDTELDEDTLSKIVEDDTLKNEDLNDLLDGLNEDDASDVEPEPPAKVEEVPYTPGEDAEEFIPPYTPGEDAAEFIPPYTPGEDAEEFVPPYTPGEDANEFEPEEEIDPVTGLPRVKVQPPPKPVIQQPPSQLPQPQANRQLDIFSLLGMLGMLGGQQQQQQPPKYEVAKEVEYTPWEQLYTPYSQDKPMSTEELIKLLRG